MKIVNIRSVIVHAEMRNWIFVRVETDQDGLFGWGEATLEWNTRSVAGAIEDLAPLVIGRDLVIVGGAVTYYYLIGHFDAAPSRLSKLTTLVQIVFVLEELLRLSRLIEIPDAARSAGIAITALLTLASGAHYAVVWSARAWRSARTRERRQA